jgi:predicted DNA-binding ribbon-helix-helix protein
MIPKLRRSFRLSGHVTSIWLEREFWEALDVIAEANKVPLRALMSEVDALRCQSPEPTSMASTLRVLCLNYYRQRVEQLGQSNERN